MSVTDDHQKYLQTKSVDLARAAEFKAAVCDTLRHMHTDEKAAELYDKMKTVQQTTFLNNVALPDRGRSRDALKIM